MFELSRRYLTPSGGQWIRAEVRSEAIQCTAVEGIHVWVQALVQVNFDKRSKMRNRFARVALLFGAKDGVVRPLHKALDNGFERGWFDEDILCSAFRVIIELKVLGLLDMVDAYNMIQLQLRRVR